MSSNSSPRNPIAWETICEEYLVLLEQDRSLTIKGFCRSRGDLNYNTARVRMPKVIKAIKERSREDQRKINPDGSKAREHNQRAHKEYFPLPEGKTTNGHGIYSKYFNPDVIELAAKGDLNDDLLLYRSKAIQGMDYIVGLQEQIANALERGDTESAANLDKMVAAADKALSWCITRIESIAMTIKKLELTTVLIVKERAAVVKTKAQTRSTVQQTKKYRNESKLAQARAAQLEKEAGSGGSAADIVREIQKRRDLLPSFTATNDERE